MKKLEILKNELNELLEDNEDLRYTGNDSEIIYIFDDVIICGGFDCGYRGYDHNILLSDNITWKDLIMNGTIVVPETHSYISSFEIERFENMDYQRLDIDKNHIVGY